MNKPDSSPVVSGQTTSQALTEVENKPSSSHTFLLGRARFTAQLLSALIWTDSVSSAFSKSSVFLSTRTRENSVFKKFHCGERFRKVPFSLIVFVGYVWTEAVSVKKMLRVQMKTDTCGQVPNDYKCPERNAQITITYFASSLTETNIFLLLNFVHLELRSASASIQPI